MIGNSWKLEAIPTDWCDFAEFKLHQDKRRRLKSSKFMNIIEYLNQKGITAKQKTAVEWCSPCPVCGGNDRFTFWPDRGRYYCRGCNKSGDIIDLIRNVDGLSFIEARNLAGFEAREPGSQRHSGECRNVSGDMDIKQHTTPCELWKKKAAEFVAAAHKRLLASPEQLAWLQKVRGITIDTVKRFQLGWNDKDRYHYRPGWGLPEVTKENGRRKTLWLPRGIVIPSYSISDELLRLKIRRPDVALQNDTDPRYVFVCGGSVAPAFFGPAKSVFVVVESELDAILLGQECGDLATPMAIGGTMNQLGHYIFTLW
ncbi:MAG: hypothetical protein GQF41_4293 [Candidatus Rifleibacterium amylolyticum]|nr:MAG: hypothetical protein GQF41_4293 [Candidatus Rifleibacterium amylolyticum]